LAKFDELKQALAQAAEQNEVKFVGVQKAGTRARPIFRVYIDTEAGITIDEIVKANRWISKLFDEYDLVKGTYDLEVSSPGIDRDRKDN
jgi:ribosome maturation factor RimP